MTIKSHGTLGMTSVTATSFEARAKTILTGNKTGQCLKSCIAWLAMRTTMFGKPGV